jgi:Acetate kinase
MLATNLDSNHRGRVMPETKTKILVCNAGSSSLKFSLFAAEDEVLLADGGVDWLTKPARLVFRGANQPEIREELKLEKHADAVARILDDLQAGASAALQSPEDPPSCRTSRCPWRRPLHSAVRINAEVKRTIEELTELAPLHNPPSLDGINAVEQVLPKVPQIAAFDTAFMQRCLRLPEPIRCRKSGHAMGHPPLRFPRTEPFLLQRRSREENRAARLAACYCHLGNGASVSAVRDGVCVDTSMGFTPLEGLMMATRSGTVDPGILIYLLRHKGLDAEELDNAL